MANGDSDRPPKDLRMPDRSSKPDTRSALQRGVDFVRTMTKGRPSPPAPASRFTFSPIPTSRTQSSPTKTRRRSRARN